MRPSPLGHYAGFLPHELATFAARPANDSIDICEAACRDIAFLGFRQIVLCRYDASAVTA